MMSMLKRRFTLTAAGVILAIASAAPAHAQGGGTGAFKWYVGGHGGVLSFRTGLQDREFMPAAGGHMLVTAKRTGLLLSVDQSFGSDELAAGSFQVVDTAGAVVQSGTNVFTFQGLRKYSAVLLAYPVRNRTVQPFVGVGVGLIHTTTNSPGFYADGGVEFRVGPVSAFGMWQVTTKSGYKQLTRVLQRDSDGDAILTRTDYGEFMRGATHTFMGGLRFSLGSARETFGTE